jgi:hypothetical protein
MFFQIGRMAYQTVNFEEDEGGIVIKYIFSELKRFKEIDYRS